MPLNCFAIFVNIVLPTPGFSEAPITAIDCGEKKIDLDIPGERHEKMVIK